MSGGVIVAVGDLVEDIVIWTPRPVAHATDNPSTVTRTRGGGAANVAWFAATSGPARFVGRVGDDILGRSLTAVLSDAGVDVRAQRVGRTGTIAILVDAAGERTMFSDRAASAELADVPISWVADAAVVHVSGYVFSREPSAATTRRLIDAARADGAAVAVDVASVDLIQTLGVAAMLELLRSVVPDVVFANADEARMLDLLAVGLPGSTVVVKDGARPATVIDPLVGRIRVPVERPVADVRDSTGAGDAFAAGYLRTMTAGGDAADCARSGHRLAAAVLTTPGAGLAPSVVPSPSPSRAESDEQEPTS